MKVLGLDLGTNSLGWAVIEQHGDEKKLFEHPHSPTFGSLIFTEGVKNEKGSEKSRAAERTQFRSARKLKFRRKLRKYETLKVLIEHDLCPLSRQELEQWRRSVDANTGTQKSFKDYPASEPFIDWQRTDDALEKNPYRFRAAFASKKQDWENVKEIRYQLGRSLYHMAQRRGFKSNRLDQSDETKKEETRDETLQFLEEARTLKEFKTGFEDQYNSYEFEKRKKKDLQGSEKDVYEVWNPVNKKLKKAKDDEFQAFKEELVEFLNRKENLGQVKGGIRDLTEEIQLANCETLGQYFWNLYQKDRNKESNRIRRRYTGREEHYEHEFNVIAEAQQFSDELRKKLHRAIFFQRPLRSQKGSVGKCVFEPKKPRCPISRPEFEEFRMWSFINTIKSDPKTKRNYAL